MSAAPDTAGALLPPPRPDGGGTYRVCCVCTGNICRSPMAEAVLSALVAGAGLSDRVAVDSAGVSDEEAGRPVHPGTRRVLARHGLALPGHRARVLDAAQVAGYDLLLAMDGGHHRVLRRYAAAHGVDPARVVLVGELDPAGSSGPVPDPWGGPDRDFEDVHDQLRPALAALVAALPAVLG